MNKLELTRRVSKETGQPVSVVAEIIDCVSKTMADDLLEDKRIIIPGIGALYLKDRKQRAGYDPYHGVPMVIPGCKCLKLDTSPAMTRRINAKYGRSINGAVVPEIITVEEKISVET